jgi:hypothetical protein
MDRHRFTSPALPLRTPAPGRDSWTRPLSLVQADLRLSVWSRTITLSALWSLTLAIAAQLLGPERFNAIRFSAAFLIAALVHLLMAGRVPASNSPMEYRR